MRVNAEPKAPSQVKRPLASPAVLKASLPFSSPQLVQRMSADDGQSARRASAPGSGHDFGRIAVHSGAAAPARVNRTGLPYRLKTGIEQLSGLSMDDVRVHRNSPAPERLGAAAHTQGTHIHVSPGQEAFLPHEAWHVVQQKRGSVAATTRVSGMGVNADPALEHEADVMGARAARQPAMAALVPPADATPAQGTVAQCGGVLSKPVGSAKPKLTDDQIRAMLRERIRQLEARNPKPAPVKKEPALTLEQRKGLRRYPRQVTREDALMDSRVGRYGAGKDQPKASREAGTGNLTPAGPGQQFDGRPVTARDHLLGRFPTKGLSSRISFANKKKAQELRDYTKATKASRAPGNAGEEKAEPPKPVTVILKARKLMRAKLKGKVDAAGPQVHTTNDLVRQINAEKMAAPAGSDAATNLEKDATTTKGYARRDAEVHAEGTVPRRFLTYSDDPQPHVSDSDSGSDVETDYSEDEL